MALTSLVVCGDASAVQVLSRVLQDLSMRVELCSDLPAAASRLDEKRFDVLLVDCEDQAGATNLISHASTRNSKERTGKPILIIAIANGDDDVKAIFAKGANFVLYKPVSAERAAESLRAARGLMPNDRRRKPRVPAGAPAKIAYANVEEATANVMNLSEDGISIRAEQQVPPRCKIYFEFTLPEQVSVVRLAGDVVWQDYSGRVGLRFDRVPKASRDILDRWLRDNLHRREESKPVPTAFTADTRPLGGLGLLSVSAPDRRGESRHACRLGADVYVLGSSTPQHCSLSDISSGGCYVETTEPLPPGTAIEIVVRTEDVKLRVQGTVLVKHPAFGMGVEFVLTTEEQREQVKQLAECQVIEGEISTGRS